MNHTFMFGAATAAHQVEGNNINSDFWKMEHLKHSSFKEPSGDACDHYNRYEEDIKLMADAGLNAYRFSVEWARIEPEEGRFDEKEIEHYKNVIDCCYVHNIRPIVTLMYFSSPSWLIKKGGWSCEYVINAFAEYCRYVAKELGDRLPYIATINEANMGLQLNKVMEDMQKGMERDGDVQVGVQLDMEQIKNSMIEQAEAFQCDPREINTFLTPRNEEQEKIVLRAHQAAVKEIRKVSPMSKIGLTLSLFDYQPSEDGKKEAEQLWFEDFGFYVPFIKDDDFLGVQNYSRKIVTFKGAMPPAKNVPVTQMGYEEYPESIGNVLRKVAEDYKGELVVTENGIATEDDGRRCKFINMAVKSVLEAKEDGVPVTGYIHWSLLDNFEWRAGYDKKFGLIAVDRTSQIRHPKKSLKVLGRLQTQ